MLPSGSDLFACRARVHVPSIRARAGRRHGRSATSPVVKLDSPKEQRANQPLGGHQNYKKQLTELSTTLNFSDDVISSRSPQSIPYVKAKRRLRDIYRVEGLQLEHLRPRVTEPVGRHDCRGQTKRHNCYLHISTEETPPNQRTHTSLPAISPDDNIEASRTFTSDVLETVPSSAAVLWEEQTLHRLSSETARRLIDDCPKPKERERLEGILGRKTQPLLEQDGSQAIPPHLGPNVEPPAMDDEAPKDFITELEGGARPVYQRGDSKRTTIVLDNNARFEKAVQRLYPQEPVDWCSTEAAPLAGRALVRGYQKWIDMPQPAKIPEELQWVCQSLESLPTGHGGNLASRIPSTAKNEFFSIMHEWCARWQIHVRLEDINESAILDGMQMICDNSRMFAISALAILAENHPQVSQHKTIQWSRDTHDGISLQLVEKLRHLVEDHVEHVRVPAAITLYCLDKQTPKAEEVLLSALASPSISERWASVQCLAVAGVGPAPVISELMTHLMGDRDRRRRERAADLLTRLSATTLLVNAMLAEQLSSSGWQERMATCQILPRLHGNINKDLSSKLVVLAWEDWSPEVRQAAAQSLGLTGHGKLIHDEIKRRLADGCETVCLDALKKLHALQLMTSQLLPEFLSCFTDDHISIRIEATEIAGSLGLREKQVLQALQDLLQDPCWKVKAHALRALGEIGVYDESLVGQLLWMLRFEKIPAVRVEACHTVARLGLKEERVIKTLKDLITVDDDPLVLREVSLALHQLGYDTERQDDMLETIRSEVKRLGTQKTITDDIIHSDHKTTTDYVIERPKALPSTRDYLSDKHRYKLYSRSHGDSRPRGTDHPPNDHTRSWSPDRKTIDRQLEAMKKRCSLSVPVN